MDEIISTVDPSGAVLCIVLPILLFCSQREQQNCLKFVAHISNFQILERNVRQSKVLCQHAQRNIGQRSIFSGRCRCDSIKFKVGTVPHRQLLHMNEEDYTTTGFLVRNKLSINLNSDVKSATCEEFNFHVIFPLF